MIQFLVNYCFTITRDQEQESQESSVCIYRLYAYYLPSFTGLKESGGYHPQEEVHTEHILSFLRAISIYVCSWWSQLPTRETTDCISAGVLTKEVVNSLSTDAGVHDQTIVWWLQHHLYTSHPALKDNIGSGYVRCLSCHCTYKWYLISFAYRIHGGQSLEWNSKIWDGPVVQRIS